MGTPAPVCLIQRDEKGDTYPTTRPIITQDAMILLIDGVGINTNTAYNTGLFLWDANDDVYINDDVTYTAVSAVTKSQYDPWYDVDFAVDSSGDVYAKQ